MPIQHLQSGSRMCQAVIRCGTVYLADIGRFDGMDRVGNAWVSPGYTPARATVRCAPDRPGNLAGIMVVAAVGPRAARLPAPGSIVSTAPFAVRIRERDSDAPQD